MDGSFTGVIRRLTGRQVLGYASQVMFEPDFVIEIFLLGPSNT
jgi:hypothetical protein